MRSRKVINAVALCVLIGCVSCASYKIESHNEGINIIPAPLELNETSPRRFELKPRTTFAIETNPDMGLTESFMRYADPLSGRRDEYIASCIVNDFLSKVNQSTGFDLKLVKERADVTIRIKLNLSSWLYSGGYTIKIKPKRIEIIGFDEEGVFRAFNTLSQLLPAEIESKQLVEEVEWTIPSVRIKDYPKRFIKRAVEIDLRDRPLSTDFVKRQIDILSNYKINELHFVYDNRMDSSRLSGQNQGVVMYAKSKFIDVVQRVNSNSVDTLKKSYLTGNAIDLEKLLADTAYQHELLQQAEASYEEKILIDLFPSDADMSEEELESLLHSYIIGLSEFMWSNKRFDKVNDSSDQRVKNANVRMKLIRE